ncbi:unnamed protein product [Spodoptera littoralis]|uniref:Exosome complex component N-terminal domain-containing protein n=1 Tax=Spodoptera littoralis TaxID=7109 RepID=A0A9P0I8T8_SPOLI|nr:unnamed protein product [Spodoptera littoralis]CAH1641456.1 unnamed protein product [Spodoptera littoralis]
MCTEKLKDSGKLCIPGMRLSLSNKEFVSGPGTYELRGYIYATLCGTLKMEQDENELPMTEIHWYHLSTAENELGVVIATAEGSPQGISMLPISWSEMQCPKTLVKESRKVARVIPENINQALFPVKNNSTTELEIEQDK